MAFVLSWLKSISRAKKSCDVKVTISCSQILGCLPTITLWVFLLNLVHDEATYVQVTIVCSPMEGSVPNIILRVLLLNLVNDELTDVQVTIVCS